MTKDEFVKKLDLLKSQFIDAIPLEVELIECEGSVNEVMSQGNRNIQLCFYVSYAVPAK